MESQKADPESEEFEIVNAPSKEESGSRDNEPTKVTPKPEVSPKETIPKKKLQNELVDYSIPIIVTTDCFSEEDLNQIFKPEFKQQNPEACEKENIQTTEKVPFLEAMKAFTISDLNRGETEKGSPTFRGTGDERLDFFFQVMERSHKDSTIDLLAKSWEKAPLDTLKLVAYLRNCREGKGVRRPYQDCLYWLYQNHPKTLANNLRHLASFGYWKDLLHFLTTIFFFGEVPHYLELDDTPGVKQKAKTRRRTQLIDIDGKLSNLKATTFVSPSSENSGCFTKKSARALLQAERWNAQNTRVFNNLLLSNLTKMDPTFKLKVPNFEYLPRKERRELTLKFARFRLETDVKYRYFHLQISKLFAEQLQKDRKVMVEPGDGKKVISLAGKWAPSTSNHFDKYTLIGTTIALELVRLENIDLKMEKPYESVRAFLARKIYHKEYLTPLRKHLKIPEVLMSAKQWNKIDYNRVAALCMRRYADIFLKHDKERFELFVSKKKKLAGATLKPIQIVSEIMNLSKQKHETQPIEMEVLESQWRSLVSDIKGSKNSSKTLSSALVICDVSGSMLGEPLYAALGLTVLVLDITEAPWNELCISFHEEPTVCAINPKNSLIQKLETLARMPAGFNTHFNKVFDLILKWADDIKEKTNSDKLVLPKTLLVFTDMEFDEAFPSTTKTNFETIKETFEKAGIDLPNIIFWNLRGDKTRPSVPVMKDENGTVLMSGYSGQLLKLILENEDIDKFNPIKMMEAAISNQAYEVLEVFD